MATSFKIEILKSSKNMEKAYIEGFIYTLNKSSPQLSHWVCENRGTCKARISTNDANVVKPTSVPDIHSSHTHGSNTSRVEMIKGITKMKTRAENSEESTRFIFASGIETMTDSAISTLVKFDSLKRTIRRHKSGREDFNISTSAEDITIPEKFRTTLKGQSFLLFDSGIGDVNRILVFGTHQMLSLLRDSSNWFADGTFKVVPNQFFQL